MTKQLIIEWADVPDGDLAGVVAALLEEFGTQGWTEEHSGKGIVWRVYFDAERTLNPLTERIESLMRQWDRPLPAFRIERVPDKDWTEPAREFFHAVHVPPCWWVAPPWEAEATGAEPEDHVIIIDPGMGFGTGHHETTQLCLELLSEFGSPGSTMLDIGAGSGIISIAAAKLGMHPIAIEREPGAVENMRRNLKANDVGGCVEAVEADFLQWSAPGAPLIVCNMERVYFCPLFPAIGRAMKPGTILIATGFIREGRGEMLDLFRQARLRVLEERQKGEWLAFVLRR